MTPKTSLYIHFHICAETTVGIAQGTSITARMTPAPLEARVDDERDDQPEHELEGDRDDGELDRDDDGVAEDRVFEQVAVVLEPDELDRLRAARNCSFVKLW